MSGQMSMQIEYIRHRNIDEGKWSRCIENSGNTRIYANIWHLDRTALVWDALVWGDYEYVMPLPVRSKFGLKYIYQPLFSQQLGIFPKPSKQVAETFYRFLAEKVKYSDINLNSENFVIQGIKGLEFLPRQNYLLDLQYNYKSLERSFATNTKRNIAKAKGNNLQYVTGISLDEFLTFKKANLVDPVSKKELEKLKSIISFGRFKQMGEIFGVYSGINELCAAVYFCRWKNRVIYFNAASSPEGKNLGAMYFLVDNFIKENAERDLILDFEGSMIPGVARFYSGFGAIPETYHQLKLNRLPLLLRWLKRK